MYRKSRYDPADPNVVIKFFGDLMIILTLFMGTLWLFGIETAKFGVFIALLLASPALLFTSIPIVLNRIARRQSVKAIFMQDEIAIGDSLEGPSVPITLANTEREGHTAILGRMGSGKSTQMRSMAKQDIKFNRPLILVDPHTELAKETTQICLSHGRLPFLLTPDTAWMNTINLLETGLGYGPMAAAQTVTEALIQVFLPYEHEAAVRIHHLTTLAAYMLAAAEEGYTILEIPRWMLQPNFRDHLARKVVQQTKNRNPLEGYQELTSLQWLNSLTRTQLHVQLQSSWTRFSNLLRHPYAQRLFGCSVGTVNFDLIRMGTPLLVGIGEEGVHRTNHLMNAFIITWITNRLLDSPRDTGNTTPISFYVDELAEISPESFERLLRHARKRSLYLTIAVQAQTMLNRNLYGTLMGNVANLLIFGSSGPGVEELAREISRPDEAERRAGSIWHFIELPRQFNNMASLIRDLPAHEFLLWQSKRSGPARPCRSLLIPPPSPNDIQEAKEYALKHQGKEVKSIDEEIMDRINRLNAKFGRLHEFDDPSPSGIIGPW